MMILEEKIPTIQAKIEDGPPLNVPEPNFKSLDIERYRLQIAKLIIERDHSQEEWQKTVEILQSTINHGIEERKRLLSSLDDYKNYLEKSQAQHNESIALVRSELKKREEETTNLKSQFEQTILDLKNTLKTKEEEINLLKEQLSLSLSLPIEKSSFNSINLPTTNKNCINNDSNDIHNDNSIHRNIDINSNPYLGKLLSENQELREKIFMLELKMEDYQIVRTKLDSSQVTIKKQLLEIEALKSDIDDIKSLYKFQVNNIYIK